MRRAVALPLQLAERLLLGVLGLAVVVGLWWLASSQLATVQLPAPDVVWSTLRTDLHSIPGLEYVSFQTESLAGALGWTVRNVLMCCALGAAIGYGAGLLIATSRLARDLLSPPLFVLATTPTLVVLPFVLIWFGPSRLAQGSLVIVFTALTVAAFTEQAAMLVGERYRQYASSLGASRLTIIREVIVPATLPNVAAGLRVSLATGWSLGTVAELIAGKDGSGRVIQSMAQLDRTADVIAVVLLLCAVAVAFDVLIVLVTKGLTPWKEQ